jgi:uncharacterized phiE125 gp8 family phage protein
MLTNIVTTSVDGDPPVCLAEAKAHARIDINTDDSLVSALIDGAVEHIEMFCRRDLIARTYDWSLDEFPGSADAICFPKHPLSSVASVQYYDTDDVLQTLPAANYTVDTGQIPGRLYLVPDEVWPDTKNKRKAIIITFSTDPGTIAPTLRVAVELLVSHWYENREAVVIGSGANELPMAVKNLLWGQRLTVEV